MSVNEATRARRVFVSLVVSIALAAVLAGGAFVAFFEDGQSILGMIFCVLAIGGAIAAADFAARRFREIRGMVDDCVEEKGRIEKVAATFNSALENMPHGVALYDGEQRILLANRRYAEMHGLEIGRAHV